jgi:hypothetical protein
VIYGVGRDPADCRRLRDVPPREKKAIAKRRGDGQGF